MGRLRVAIAMDPRLAGHAFDDADLDRLRAIADVVDEERDADVLLGHWGCHPLDEATLDGMPDLRLFAYAAGTVKGIVTDAVWSRGITVTSAAAANAVPVAEYTVAMILLANKGALVARERLKDRDLRARMPRPVGNVDKRVGIIGASLVGRKVIELLSPFDLEVVVTDPYLGDDEAHRLGVQRVELDELFATSDVVSLHAPDIPETAGMVGADQLARLRDGGTFVNTARPRLVDHDALEAELRSGRISAVLDVTEPEPLPADASILRLPNAFVTPHLAGAQGTELRRLAALAIDEIERFSRGEPPRHPVTADRFGITA